MATKPEDVYNSVPSAAPEVGSPQNYVNVRATPSDFGAQIGGALQQTGEKVEAGEQQLFNTGLQYQGIVNETWAASASSIQNQKLGQLDGEFKSLQGPAAMAALPDYQAKVAKIREDLLEGAPNPAAGRAFNMTASRAEGFTLRDYGTYAGTQLKAGRTQANNDLLNQTVESLSNADVAANPQRMGDAIGTAKHLASTIVADQGYQSGMIMDSTGNVSFTSTPEGDQAKAVYNQYTTKVLDQGFKNAANALGYGVNGDVTKAVSFINQYKDSMPATTYADLSKQFAAPYRMVQTRTAALQTTQSYDQQYTQMVDDAVKGKVPPPTLQSVFRAQESNNNPNATSSAGAHGLYQITPTLFNQFAKPGENFNNAVDNQAVSERALQHFTDVYKDDPARVAVAWYSGQSNVASEGSPTPYIRNVSQDRNGNPIKPVSSYVSDIMNRLSSGSNGVPAYQSRTDFYRTHISDITEAAGNSYAVLHPDDIQGIEQAKSQAFSHIQNQITQQEVSVKADKDSVVTWMHNNNITDPAQIRNAPPDVQHAWTNAWANDSYNMQGFTNNLVKANATGIAVGPGQDFYSHFHDVLSGKINNITQLGPFIGNDKNGAITNTGLGIIQQTASDRQKDPAFAAAEQKFFEKLHNEATGANVFPDINSPKLNQNFNKGLPALINQINAAKASGKNAGDLFNEDSKDYVGKSFQLPKPAEVQSEHFSQLMGRIGIPDIKGQGGTEQLIKTLDDPSQTRDQKAAALEAAWNSGQGVINSKQADQLGRQYKLYNYAPKPAAGPSVPLPSDK